MVLVGQAIRSGLRLAGKIDRKYNINKIFIDKYVPPGSRKLARQIVDIAGIAGGAYGLYQYLIADDSPGNGASIPFRKLPQTSKSYKTRGRSAVRFRRSCKPRSYSGFRKRYSRSRYSR